MSAGHDRVTGVGMIADWIAAWDGQGSHRTATAGDEAGADWLAGAAAALGARVTEERFALDRIDPVTARVAWGDTVIEGVALFDAPDGRAEGPAGAIGQRGAVIGIGSFGPHTVYDEAFHAMRREAGHRALVIATTGGAPGLALLNAERFSAPYGPPILQVASEHAAALDGAARNGAELRVHIEARRPRATARNIMVTIPGRDPALAPLVVMTPRSSWWTSTAERGGGLAIWLACLRAVLPSTPARDVVFTANSGHELGHIGLDAFLHHRPDWLRRATWLHWGANIGARDGRLAVMSGHDDLRRAMSSALSAQGQPHAEAPGDAVPKGESRDIHRAGGRYVTLVGDSPLFHLPQDRLPHAVDIAAVGRTAAAASGLAVALAG